VRCGRLALAIVALLLGSAGLAAPVDDAREHYKKGTTLYDLQRFHEAAIEYERAFEIVDDPALLFNIAQAYRFAAEYGKAIGAFKAYLRRVPQAPNRSEVEARIVDMQRLQAEQKKSGEEPPAGTIVPAQRPSPQPAAAASPSLVTTNPPPTTTVRKKTWLWVTIGVSAAAAVALGVGLGVGLGEANSAPPTPFARVNAN